ncbi:hypothetical protein Ciccas_012546 [Cichlidogyrus casuarinus]|uniref:PARG catalytic Macro domain-containing protein n=1 Tax=Cichlidogyrus casuarinus TaxID=1844966 RepID=A0ABD2PPV9_9PLAT
MISFTRTHCEDIDFKQCQALFGKISVVVVNEEQGEVKEIIEVRNEPNKHKYAHVVFSNNLLGGSTLEGGSEQEVNLFLTHPECIAGMAFCEGMSVNEAIIIQGARQYTETTISDRKLKCVGLCTDPGANVLITRKTGTIGHQPGAGHLAKTFICIDATDFAADRLEQFHEDWIHCELVKAYAGFSAKLADSEIPDTIVTGNWGCGAECGDRKLKAVIQLMACAAAKKNLYYCCEGDQELLTQLTQLSTQIKAKKDLTVAQLFERVTARAKICAETKRDFDLKDLLVQEASKTG